KVKNYNPDWIENEFKSNRVENSIRYDINDIFTLRTNTFYEKMKHKARNINITYKNGYSIGDDSWSGTWSSNDAWQETKNYGTNIYLDSKFNTGSVGHTITTGYSLSESTNYKHKDEGKYYLYKNNMTLGELKKLDIPRTGYISFTGYDTIGEEALTKSREWQFENILIGDDIVFNEQWSALVGLNYATIVFNNNQNNTKYKESKLTPTLSLIYKPFENLTTYATYIESLEEGTIVGSYYQNDGEILSPYKSKQYEIGAKYSMLDERALLTASLFRIERANQYTDNTTTPKPTLTQDGEAIHQGIEIGLIGKVTDNLTLMGGVTFMDLGIEKHTNKDIEGKKPIEAATKMAKLYSEYNIPYINGLSINAGAYYTGKKYSDEANTDILPSYTLYDAGLRYSTKLGNYPTSFNLNVQNLTDKVYWTNGNMLGDPRSVAFSMKMEF
ncbi:TonB-dependent receptor, partial [Aliarcobacter vitoriensis]